MISAFARVQRGQVMVDLRSIGSALGRGRIARLFSRGCQLVHIGLGVVIDITFIRRSRDLGFTLEEIRALLALGGSVCTIAGAHLGNVRKKLFDLVKLEASLAETVARCSDGATPRQPDARYSGCRPTKLEPVLN